MMRLWQFFVWLVLLMSPWQRLDPQAAPRPTEPSEMERMVEELSEMVNTAQREIKDSHGFFAVMKPLPSRLDMMDVQLDELDSGLNGTAIRQHDSESSLSQLQRELESRLDDLDSGQNGLVSRQGEMESALAQLQEELEESINIALGQDTVQSSTYHGVGPTRAVDGVISGIWTHNSCSCTQFQTNPWWMVDLGSTRAICTVVVYNRLDCCSNRLDPFYVYVGDNSAVTQNPNCGGEQSVSGAGKTVWCNGLRGRYVGIGLSGSNRMLTLCEVEVYENWGCQESSTLK